MDEPSPPSPFIGILRCLRVKGLEAPPPPPSLSLTRRSLALSFRLRRGRVKKRITTLVFLARCPWHSVFECRPIPPIRPTTSIYDNNRLTHLAFPPSFPPTEATNDALARSLAIRCSLMRARSEDASPPRRQKGFSLPFRGFLMSSSLSFRFGRAPGPKFSDGS